MSRLRRPRFQPPSRPPGPPLPTGGHRAPLVPGASGPAPTEPQPRVPHLAAPPLGAQHTPPAALTPLPARGGCSPGTHPHPTAAPAPPSQLHGPQLSGRETDHPLLLLGGGGRELRRPPRWRLTTNSAPPGGAAQLLRLGHSPDLSLTLLWAKNPTAPTPGPKACRQQLRPQLPCPGGVPRTPLPSDPTIPRATSLPPTAHRFKP